MTDAELVARIIGTIDADRFAAIRSEFATAPYAKYLDLTYWIGSNLRRVRAARLDSRPRRRVLDLGCGAGYFLYICKLLGHDVEGIDLPDDEMFRAITNLLNVPVTYARVEPFVALPKWWLGPIDVLAAHMITFNGHCSDRVWGPDEWRFLLDDVGAPVVSLELNREPDGTIFPAGVRELFEQRGARIDVHRVLIDRP